VVLSLTFPPPVAAGNTAPAATGDAAPPRLITAVLLSGNFALGLVLPPETPSMDAERGGVAHTALLANIVFGGRPTQPRRPEGTDHNSMAI